MKFQVQAGVFQDKSADCLIIGVFEKGELSETAKKLDKMSQRYISQILKKGDFKAKTGETFLLYHLPHTKVERVLLVGCGDKTTLSDRDYRKITLSAIQALRAFKVAECQFYLSELTVQDRDLAWKVKQTVEVTREALYSFNEYKSQKDPLNLQSMTLHVSERPQLKSAEKALKQGLAIADGVEFTKNLANTPSNICNPSYLAEQAKKLAKKYKKFTVKVLEEKDMKKLGMGAFLAVSQGSAQDAKLICLQYQGGPKNQAPFALVGKGITFDTGGISLKPADAMVGMKYDMCGAATVLGTLKSAAELELPLNLVGVLATAENMPSGTATKPEDIVTTMSGQTVEIMNTDAEGRLVLCDALTYCEQFKPQAVIDIATLTGAVVIALGMHATGLISNNEKLAQALLTAGTESFDRAWQLPLWEEYQDQLKSPFADMSNVGGRAGGTITAGCFLSRFAKKFPWAHLDVAGTAAMMMGGNDRYATGRPVPLLVQYLLNQSNRHHAKD